MKYRVLVEQDEDGVFVAEVPSLPGCISQGATRHEAMNGIREAMKMYPESPEAHGDPVPPPVSEEIAKTGRGAAISSSDATISRIGGSLFGSLL